MKKSKKILNFESKESFSWAKIGPIRVYYLPELDGGGRQFEQEFVQLVKKLIGRMKSVLEFAAGPGFIGFSLLAHGIAKDLTLIDVNPNAIECCRRTINANKLKGVKVYLSDGFKNVPKSEEWDLIVGNLPHFKGTARDYKKSKILIDPNWKIHKDFYGNVKQFLKKGGAALLVENYKGSDPHYWIKLISANGLSTAQIINQKKSMLTSKIFSLIIEEFKLILKREKYRNNLKLKRESRRVAHMMFPHYFVWAKK